MNLAYPGIFFGERPERWGAAGALAQAILSGALVLAAKGWWTLR